MQRMNKSHPYRGSRDGRIVGYIDCFWTGYHREWRRRWRWWLRSASYRTVMNTGRNDRLFGAEWDGCFLHDDVIGFHGRRWGVDDSCGGIDDICGENVFLMNDIDSWFFVTTMKVMFHFYETAHVLVHGIDALTYHLWLCKTVWICYGLENEHTGVGARRTEPLPKRKLL